MLEIVTLLLLAWQGNVSMFVTGKAQLFVISKTKNARVDLPQLWQPPKKKAVAHIVALVPIPAELSELNILEQQLIAKILPFAKIIALPKRQQRAIRGAVCLRSDVETTVNLLQRRSNEGQLLQVKLKRHTRYKGYQHFYTEHKECVSRTIKTKRNIFRIQRCVNWWGSYFIKSHR